ncbi:MAG TPA: TolC family protein [Mucilaginibacter sp.]|nr:TolC family protein [Mucilaginibacter sp.]
MALWGCLVLRTSLLSAQQSAGTALPLSLQQVWQKSDVYSKAIQMQKVKVQRSKEEIRDAVMERLPELSVGGNFEQATNIPVYEHGLFSAPTQHEVIHTLYKIGADGYLNIYNGSKTNLEIAEEKTHDKIAIEQQNLTVSDIRYRAAARYLELQRSMIFKNLMIKDIADQEKQLAEIRQFLKNGVVLKSDVLRVELKLSRQKLSLVTIENDISLSNQKLNILIGEPDEQIVIPTDKAGPDALTLGTYESYLSEAMAKSFQYRISAQETELKKIELKNVKANVSLKVGLYGDFYYANPQIFLYPYNPHLYSLGIAGVRASFPLSAIYLNRHKEKIAELELKNQELEHSDTEDNVRKQVKEAYLRYKEALIGIDVARVNVEQAKENYRIVNNTYFNQSSLITDLLDAGVQLLQTRFDLATAEMAASLQYYQLQNVVGNL